MSLAWLKRKPAEPSAAVDPPKASAPLAREEVLRQMLHVEALLSDGKVDEALEWLRKLANTNPDEPEVIAHLGICQNLLGDMEAAIEPLLAATKLAPKNSRAWYFLGGSLAAMGDLDQARVAVQHGLTVAPRDLNLLVLAGTISGRIGATKEAAQLLNKALEFHPDDIAPLHTLEMLAQQTLRRSSLYDLSPKIADLRKRTTNRLLAAYRKGRLVDADILAGLLAVLSGSSERFATAVEIARASVHFQPMTSALAQQMFLIFWAAGDQVQALRFSEMCYEFDPSASNYREALCSAWLACGSEHWSAAWRLLTEIQQRARPDQHQQTVPMWAGEKLGKKKLLVYQDQGMGDAIIGFRFLPLLAARGIKFDLWVLPPIAELAACAPGYESLIRTDYRLDPAALGYSFAAPLFGLIQALFLGPEEVRLPPVVRPPRDQARELREQVAALPGLRIGMVYGGNPDRRDDWLRSVPLDALQGIAALRGVSWINLMVDERPDKARALQSFRMFDPMPHVRNFADTAAVVEELDAIVAVDCAVAHLAGNLGKPLWVLVPPSLDWRWQMGEDKNPWWPTARLLRSGAPRVWTDAISMLENELRTHLEKHKGRAPDPA